MGEQDLLKLSWTRKGPVSGLKGCPLEAEEQRLLVEHLRRARIVAYHVPNEGRRSKRRGAALKGMGLEPGVPDLIVVSRTRLAPHGVALEMKRQSGTWAQVSQDQRRWLWLLEAVEQRTPVVGYGWRDAVAKLRYLGYALALCVALWAGPVDALPRYQQRPHLEAVVGSPGLAAEMDVAGSLADVDPLYMAAVTYTESRWTGRRDGDHGRSIGLWQMTASAVRSMDRGLTRAAAQRLLRVPYVRSVVAGYYWRRLIRRYGRRSAAAVYTCGPRCRGMALTRTVRNYWRAYARLMGAER